MAIKFRILSEDKVNNSAIVRFFSDDLSEDSLAILNVDGVIVRAEDDSPAKCRTDVNIEFPVPTPANFNPTEFISKFSPTEWLEREALVKDTPAPILPSAVTVVIPREKIPLPPKVTAWGIRKW